MKRTDHNREQTRYFSGGVKPTMVPDGTPYIERQIDEVVRYAGIQPGHRVLEVGCGMGRYTIGLASRGIAIEGLDLVPFLLARLKEFAGELRIPLYCADVIEPPPQFRGSFDAVIGFFALHHMHDVVASYRSMAGLLRPGGTIVFLEPNAWNPLYYLQILLTPGMTWKGDRGIVDMRRAPIFNAMRAAGLVDLEIRRFGFFPPQIYNRALGRKLDHVLGDIRVLNSLLPFQMFKGSAPR
jgi:SAM-dependent methyltransferase